MRDLLKVFGLLSVLLASSTHANASDLNGSISLRDGERVVRINVGNDDGRDNKNMARRIRRLEMAVRSLQNRVYDLEDDTRNRQREVTIFTCVLPTSFDGTFIGKGKTEAEARANAVNACDEGDGFPCRDRSITSCERSTVYE